MKNCSKASLVFAFISFVTSCSNDRNKPYLYQVTHPFDHGEGPTWSEKHRSLRFVDLHAGKILTYDPIADELRTVQLNGDVSVVVPSKNDPNLFVAAVNRSLIALKLKNDNAVVKQKTLATVADDKPTSRFNDGKADRNGRLWFGTMGFENSSGVVPNEGSLYLFQRDELPDIKIAPVTVSNGLTWSGDDTKFFYIDSPTRQISMYDYDAEKASIANKRVLFDFKDHPQLGGVPDGMTIDKDDNLWIALYDGGSVIKVDSRTGKLLQVIAIPARYVTSVAWGGASLDVLYVTTSRYNLKRDGRAKEPAAGSLFAVENLGTGGLPMHEADIIDDI